MSSLPDYRSDPIAYELEEKVRPDEMIMFDKVAAACVAFAQSIDDNIRVIDLCCGTGLSLNGIINAKKVSEVIGVDNCEPYLSFAKERFATADPRPTFILADAVDVTLEEGKWDIVILCSAYHHIEDPRKLAFLEKAVRLLSARGVMIIGENILPPYNLDDRTSYRKAVSSFYDTVLHDALIADPHLDLYVRQLIERVAQYGFDGDYEYKVCNSIFLEHLRKAGLVIESCERVWPADEERLPENAGNFVVVARHSDRS